MSDTSGQINLASDPRPGAAVRKRTAFWIALWLAVALIVCKAAAPKESFEVVAQTSAEKVRYLVVMTHEDLLYAAGVGVVGALLLFLARRRKRAAAAVW